MKDCVFLIMKNKLYKNIYEADDIQSGDGGSNASQETNTNIQYDQQNNTTEITDLSKKIITLNNRKSKLKTQYASDLKIINDQIILYDKDRGELASSKPNDKEQEKINQTKYIQLNNKINELINRKLTLKTQLQQNLKNIEMEMVNVNKDIANAGGNVDIKCIDESEMKKYRISKKLYENVMNRTDEMFALICMAFDQIDNLSYKPDKTKCRTFAKNIIAYLNKLGWDSGEHEEDFENFLYTFINSSHISLGNSEKTKFVKNLTDLMRDNGLFRWVFV